jgi:G:T-mismatch repair DNA endonuclease (very short patch repair protein)
MYTKVQLDYLYSLLIDESNNIFSLTNETILQYLGIKKRRQYINTLKEEFYALYDNDSLQKYLKRKQGIYGNKILNSVKRVYSEESKEKMSVSRKEFWESIKGTDRELELKLISKNSMKRINDLRLNQTTDVKKSRVETRKENNEFWHSDATKNKIGNSQIGKVVSESTKCKQSDVARKPGRYKNTRTLKSATKLKISETVTFLHRIGVYPLKTKSKGHCQVESILVGMGYFVSNEYRIGRYSYDMYISDINTIIEFHGTYWHLDPKKYDSEFFDNSKKRYAKDQWERDDIRKAHAISNGMNYLVVWQLEWEAFNEQEKINKIKQLLSYA